ncbi:MAG: CAAX prenyl protease-related protein [Gemmatimonadales bacterium]
MSAVTERRTAPFVVPFAVFAAILVVAPRLSLSPRVLGAGWLVVMAVVIAVWSRGVVSFRLERPLGTALLGVGVFLLWIGPDLLIPGYRDGWLFQNAVTGRAESSFPAEGRGDLLALLLRFARAAVVVPIAEELFWRGWLPRWVDRPDGFAEAPLGRYTAWSFGVTALLFAAEHGAFWDVGLLAGVAYNWWLIRTRSLGDLIWCHAITNGCLSAYVIWGGHWQYW